MLGQEFTLTVWSNARAGGFLTDHFPSATKAIWHFDGIYCSSRHIPGVRFPGIIHPGAPLLPHIGYFSRFCSSYPKPGAPPALHCIPASLRAPACIGRRKHLQLTSSNIAAAYVPANRQVPGNLCDIDCNMAFSDQEAY